MSLQKMWQELSARAGAGAVQNEWGETILVLGRETGLRRDVGGGRGRGRGAFTVNESLYDKEWARGERLLQSVFLIHTCVWTKVGVKNMAIYEDGSMAKIAFSFSFSETFLEPKNTKREPNSVFWLPL